MTHPQIYRPPASPGGAICQVNYWLESPALRLIGETPAAGSRLKSLLTTRKPVGPVVHGARVAAV